MAGFDNNSGLYDSAFYATIGQDTLGNTGNGSTMADRSNINNAMTPTSGNLYAQQVYLPANTVIQRLTFRTTTGGTALTAWWLAVLDATFTVLAETADQGSTALGGFTNFTVPLSQQLVIPSSGIYYFAMCQIATTPALIASQATTGSPAFAIKPIHNFMVAGQTGPVGAGFTYTPALTNQGQTCWILSS